jgi:hypothetical protein
LTAEVVAQAEAEMEARIAAFKAQQKGA